MSDETRTVTPAIQSVASKTWSDVVRAMRAEHVSDAHAVAWADIIRIDLENRLAAALPDATVCRAAQADTAPGGGLDAAWAAAEAELPDGWQMGSIRAAVAFGRGFDAVATTKGWTATAYSSFGVSVTKEGRGDTVAAALHDLAARLAPQPDGELIQDANGDELEHGEPDYPSQYDPQDNRWDLAAKAQRDGDHAEPPVSGQFGAARERQGGGS